YVAYTLYLIFIIDRTDAYLNGYSFDDYPYLSRGIKTILPVIGIYFIYTILSVLGFILLIVPGLIVVAGLYVAIPAKLSENISILAALQRSWTLTKGHRLTIWGVILIPLIPILIITYIGMFSMLGDLRETGDISVMLSPAYLIINTAFNAVITTFFIIAMTVCYHQIKYENLDVPE
ncbi:MAG TPA: hypothetical protein PK690_13950, partial [Emcibacteraceae bacterium]|nr:hypothetical protein [Emcibacteraceae bacterium]